MENEKKKTIIVVILLIAIIVIIGIFIISKNSKGNSKEENYINSKISMVTDASRFYTVSSCVSKYITYLSSNESSAIFRLLDPKYKDKNAITLLNLNEFIKPLNGNYEFTAGKMYQEKINDNIMKYYVSGTIRPDQFFENAKDYYLTENNQEYYIIIYLDFNRQIFSVEPYDGVIFNGGKS